MKDNSRAAELTPELPGLPRAVRRGRPPKADALTPAERMRSYRQRQAERLKRVGRESCEILEKAP